MRTLVWSFVTLFTGAAAALAGLFLYLDPLTPSAESYRHLRLETPLRIYTADGKLAGEFGERRLVPIPLSEMPPQFVRAVLDTEDKRFYEHYGVDWLSWGNVLRELLSGQDPRGASTITMQMARNISLSPERLVMRKLKEILLALKIEQELTKDEILELYLNMVPFGKRAYGAEAAALTYYGKPLKELDLAQWAMLAGIPQRPSGNNPVNDPTAALARRNHVLGRMREQGTITAAEYSEAIASPVAARVHTQQAETDARYAAEMARRELFRKFGGSIYSTGMVVELTVDSATQEAANAAVRKGIASYDRRHGYRGAEARFQVPAGRVDDQLRRDWQEKLLTLPNPAGLEPAVVTRVGVEQFNAMLSDGTEIAVRQSGFGWAAPYVDEDRVGGRPASAPEVVRLGEVIRVRQDGARQHWDLAQMPAIQAALAAVDPRSGEIKALVGGFDFGLEQFDHSSQATRQPGSGFKPFVYSAALDRGITPSSIILDGPITLRGANGKVYAPENFGARYFGPVRLREALYRSLNTVSVRLVLKIGAGYTKEYAKRFGFDVANFPSDVQLALGAGTIAVSPLDMAEGYSVFANGGYLITPHVIRRVRSDAGKVMYEAEEPSVCEACERRQNANAVAYGQLDRTGIEGVKADQKFAPRAIDARNAFVMNSLLSDVVVRGTATRAGREMGRSDLRGKTGTTNSADAWFNGFSPDVVASVWLGFSDGRAIGRRETGASAALPIWIDFMRQVLEGKPERNLVEPPGIIRVRIDPSSGQPASAYQANAFFEVFIAEHAPTIENGSAGIEGQAGPSPTGIF